MGRLTKAATQDRATAAVLRALTAQVERLAVAVEQLRAGQPSRLGRAEDVCRILNISRATFWRHVADGTIPVVRVGRSVRVDLAALDGPSRTKANEGEP